MQLKYFILFLILCFSFCSCKKDHTIVNPLEKALSSELPNIKSVMDNLEEHQFQIR